MKKIKSILLFIMSCTIGWLAIHGANCYIEEYQCNRDQITLKEKWTRIVKNRKFDFKKDHHQIQDGTTMEINEIFALACCDCGLSHIHRFYENNGNYYISFWRNKHMTKLNREAIDYLCKPEERIQTIAHVTHSYE